MCRLGNTARSDYQESVTTGQTQRHTDGRTERQTPEKVIPMCRYASQATQKVCLAFMTIYDYITISERVLSEWRQVLQYFKNKHEYFETNSLSARQSCKGHFASMLFFNFMAFMKFRKYLYLKSPIKIVPLNNSLSLHSRG